MWPRSGCRSSSSSGRIRCRRSMYRSERRSRAFPGSSLRQTTRRSTAISPGRWPTAALAAFPPAPCRRRPSRRSRSRWTSEPVVFDRFSQARPPAGGRAFFILALVLLAGCRADRTPAARQPIGAASSGPGPEHEWFVDRAQETGLDFVHFNGMSGQCYYPEDLAPRVAMFDYDNDGDLDIFLVQGQMLGEGTPLFPPQGPLPLEGRLFRNDLKVNADGTRTLQFIDVTEASGI